MLKKSSLYSSSKIGEAEKEILERGKMERDVIEVVGIGSFIPEEYPLRK